MSSSSLPGHIGERIDPRLSYEDYCALPDDGRRYQIIGGALDVTPVPTSTHQRVSRNLEFLLFNHVRRHKLGSVLYAPVDVILSDDTMVQPDLVYVSRANLARVAERGIEGPPDLVVELLSPKTRRLDRTTKMRVYAQFSVPECWIVDPDAKTFEIFKLTAGAYVLVQAASGDESVQSGLFPGLTIPLPPLFAPDF